MSGHRDTEPVKATLHDQAQTFLLEAESFFAVDPFSSSVVAVVAARVATGEPIGGHDRLFVTVDGSAGEVLGVAMHTPPHSLFVSRMPAEAAAAVADALADIDRVLPGVNGECEATAAFADAWERKTGQSSNAVTAMRMYQLAGLAPPAEVPGEPVRAAAGEAELVAEWLAAFHAEAMRRAPAEDWNDDARRKIAGGGIYLWRDGGAPVSVAGVSKPAAGVARVGPVYTPPSARRRGYGAAVTAAATAAALEDGAEHVVLYTDLANPTSNSIYQAIGYRPNHDADERVFQ